MKPRRKNNQMNNTDYCKFCYDSDDKNVPYRQFLKIFSFYINILFVMYFCGELSSKTDRFELMYFIKFAIVAICLALGIAVHGLLFNISRIEFADDGIILSSTGKYLFNIGRSKFIPYASLSVMEWKYWKIKEFNSLRITQNKRYITNISDAVWKGKYPLIRKILKEKTHPERWIVYRIG